MDVDNLLISQPDTGEQALEITETLVRSGALDLVVVDSGGRTGPALGDRGRHGRCHDGYAGAPDVPGAAQAFRRHQPDQHRGGLHQPDPPEDRRDFGNPETTPGGMALKFYASVRMDVRRIQSIKLGAEIVGNRTRVRVVKNKVAAPFRTAEFDIMYNEGISKAGDMLDLATSLDIVTKRGAFYSYGDMRLGQGRENAKEFLKQNPDLMEEVELAVRQQSQAGGVAIPYDGSDDEGETEMADE